MKFKRPYCLTYEALCDDFQHRKFIYPGTLFLLYLIAALLMALLVHTRLSLFELSWSFSIWLEALAIIPQLRMLTKMKDVENLTSNYMAALGLYRLFYIFHWYYSSLLFI
jgi:ER lumen protein retaining receptor